MALDPTCFDKIKGNKCSYALKSIEIWPFQGRFVKELLKDRVPFRNDVLDDSISVFYR